MLALDHPDDGFELHALLHFCVCIEGGMHLVFPSRQKKIKPVRCFLRLVWAQQV